MGRKFIAARSGSGTVPEVREVQYDSAQTFKQGAVLVYDTDGEVIEASADPAQIAGVAAQGANTNPGYDAANSPTVITGRKQTVAMWPANRMTTFSGRGVNGGTDPVTPALTDIDTRCSIVKSGDDWVLDLSDTTNDRVEIVDVDIDQKIFFFKFLDTVIDEVTD